MATDEWDDVLGVHTKLTADVDAIRKNPRLTPDERNTRIARVYRTAERQAGSMREQLAARIAADRKALEAKAFGRPDGVAAADDRDALARCEATGDDRTLAQVIRRATQAGDTSLVRAAGVVAAERGWRQTLAVFREQHPDRAAAMDDLATLDRHVTSPKFRIQADARFHPSRPSELATLNDYAIDKLAGDTS